MKRKPVEMIVVNPRRVTLRDLVRVAHAGGLELHVQLYQKVEPKIRIKKGKKRG